MQTTLKLYSLSFRERNTYLAATMFVIGNIVLPQLFHLLPQGGITWLPIYFFTLIGAYKYGWRVGLMTALASPLINSMIFGMPAVQMLPIIIVKSSLLAIIAGFTAGKFNKATIGLLALVVLGYQSIGTACEWLMTGNVNAAFQDFRIGIPGMLMQVIGGWLIINRVIRK
ncbi:MAG: ECF transporter S component [Muribaculaceae bacterium]|nr:ECF transporter S component [Muribaculaceae bacterium]